MSDSFDIRSETRATTFHFLYRQLFVKAPIVSRPGTNLEDKTAIVTGSNSGVGLETARQLLSLGAKVILAVRDESKGREARQQLLGVQNLSTDSIEVWKLDLASYDSIIKFVDRVRDLQSLDIAILNAGVFNVHESFSWTGYEETLQINYLSNILFTVLLLPVMKAKRSGSGPGRIVLVTSDTAAWAKFEERNSNTILPGFKKQKKNWDMAERYATSKLLGQLFLTELARHISSATVTVACANPGLCYGSNIRRQASGLMRFVYTGLFFLLGRTCSVGARTIIHAAAVLGEEVHGQYVEDGKVQPMPPIVYGPEGLHIAKLLYEETLSDLSFAGSRDILDAL